MPWNVLLVFNHRTTSQLQFKSPLENDICRWSCQELNVLRKETMLQTYICCHLGF